MDSKQSCSVFEKLQLPSWNSHETLMFSEHWTMVLNACVEGRGSIQVARRVTLYMIGGEGRRFALKCPERREDSMQCPG